MDVTNQPVMISCLKKPRSYIDMGNMKTFKYEHNRTGVSGKMCLGVEDCDKKLFLLTPNDPKDRRCLFRKLI